MELAAGEPYQAHDDESNDEEEVDYIDDDDADDNDENTSFLGSWVGNAYSLTLTRL